MIRDDNVLVLVFPNLEASADGMLAIQALREGDYPVWGAGVNLTVPEFDGVEILDMEAYAQRKGGKETPK